MIDMAGHEVPIVWQGRRGNAWVPDPLPDRGLDLTEGAVRHTDQAAAAARRGSDELPARWEPLARLLLRAESVASSFIEGVRTPLPSTPSRRLLSPTPSSR